MGVTFIGMMRELANLFAPRGNAIARRFSAMHGMSEKSGDEAY
jgi:hypothetical protein